MSKKILTDGKNGKRRFLEVLLEDQEQQNQYSQREEFEFEMYNKKRQRKASDNYDPQSNDSEDWRNDCNYGFGVSQSVI